MKKSIALMLVLVLLVGVIGAVSAGREKVTICHKPGTRAQSTITVAEPALAAHLAHGDVIGDCESIDFRSDLCIYLDGFLGYIYYPYYFYGTLKHEEVITASINYLDNVPGDVSVEISSAPVGSPGEVYKFGTSLGSPTVTLTNLVDPAGQTYFAAFGRGDVGFTFLLSCSLPDKVK